jgi:O-antigen ligase
MSSAFDSVNSGRSGVTDLLSRQGEHDAANARFIDVPADETRQPKADAVTLLTCYLFLLMAIPAPLVFAPLGGAGGPATIFAALLLGCYLLTLIHPALALDRGPQPVRIAAVVLTCAVIATYISANRRTLPGLEENGADRGLIIMFGWLGVMLLAADGIPSMARLKTLLGRVIFGATAMASLAIVQFFTGLNASQYIVIPGLTTQTPFTDLLTRDQLNRPSATAINPIELAVVLAVCLVIAVHRARFAPDGRRGRRWVQVAIIAIALPMTVSRTGIVSLVVAGLVLLPTWPKWDRRAAYVAGLAGTAFLFATKPGLLGEFRSLFLQVGSDTSSASRTGAFSASLPFIMQHPWLGRGFGTFLPATYFFTDDQFLLTFIETGVIGLTALLALFITGWLTARSARRMSKNPEVRDLGQTMAATVAIAAVSFATLDELSFAIAASLTFLIIGCAGALWRLVRAERSAALAAAGPAAPPTVSPAPAPAGAVNPVPAPAGAVNPVPAPARTVNPAPAAFTPSPAAAVAPWAEAMAPPAPERAASPAEVPLPAAAVTPPGVTTPAEVPLPAAAVTPPGVTTPAEVLPRPEAAIPRAEVLLRPEAATSPAEDVSPPAATTPPRPAELGPAPEAAASPAGAGPSPEAAAQEAKASPPPEAAPSPPTSWAFTPARSAQPAQPEAATPASAPPARGWPPPAAAAPRPEVTAQEAAPSPRPAEEASATVFPVPASSADHAPAGAEHERAGAEREPAYREDDTIPIPVVRDDPAPPAE